MSRLVLILSVLATASSVLFTEDKNFQKELWESYKNDFNKNYESMDEENSKFSNFLQMLKTIDERNEMERHTNGSAVHGLTRFSDMSQEEFESKFLNADMSQKSPDSEKSFDEDTSMPSTTSGLVDWTGKYTTPVKNQQQCGSCWAFSAAEQIESDSMRTLGKKWTLSPEQIVQCDRTSQGCNGGWTEHAYKYVQGNGGLCTESEYPYTSGRGVTGQCQTSSKHDYVVTVTGYKTVKGESSMASYVQKTGPLSVCVDASKWNTYTGGIMTSCGNRVDHCVQAVGVDASSKGYWKVRNSWGVTWGESGYIRLAYGKNMCDITNDPTYTSVKKV
jgi:C1A family cysteine protease